MANLPQVLDQNHVMGASIAEPTLQVLQVTFHYYLNDQKYLFLLDLQNIFFILFYYVYFQIIDVIYPILSS